MIEARDVVKSFGQTPALRGASVSVARGEILAVMGPSGSGKSTLLHCLAGILVPESGEIRFAGRRIDALAENERSALRRDRFGFVFQFGRLGLDGLEAHRSGEMSGGQAQRVALARGLVAGPEVLFADEPTGSLDSLAGEQVMNLLTDAARDQGTTVVVVTHEPRVAAYADREVIVRDGKVTSPFPAGAVS